MSAEETDQSLALVFSGDITDYWSYTLVRDYLLLMPGLPHPALRMYEILRSMIAEANKNRPGQRLRRMTIDQLCWLLTDDLGKPVSVSSMYEILGVLERLELVVPRDTQAAEGGSQLKGKEKAARGILRGYTVRDLPKASHTGWRNAWDKLSAYRPDWRESRPEPPTHLTSFIEDAEHHRMARVRLVGGVLEVFQDSGTADAEGAGPASEDDPFQDSGTSFQDSGTAFRESGTDLASTSGNADPKEASPRSLSKKNYRPSVRNAGASGMDGGTDGSSGVEGEGDEPGEPSGVALKTPAEGAAVLLEVARRQPRLALAGNPLRDQALRIEGLLANGWSSNDLVLLLATDPPVDMRTPGGIMSKRISFIPEKPAVLPQQLDSSGAAGTVPERSTTAAAGRSVAEAKRDPVPSCSRCADLPVPGYEQCAKCLGWPLCAALCGSRVASGGLCPACAEDAYRRSVAAPVTEDGLCPGHDGPCGRSVVSLGWCRRCLSAVECARQAVAAPN